MKWPALILLLIAAPAAAASLMRDDFERGDAAGWRARGNGDVRVTEYAGNKSIRLTDRAEALTAFSARGQTHVAIAARIAAADLEPGEACVLEASGDKGLNWFEIGRVDDGRDDGVTLYAVGAEVPALDGKDPVYVRARAAGNDATDLCWFDAVRASGTPLNAGEKHLAAAGFTTGVPFAVPADLAAFAPGTVPPQQAFEGLLQLRLDPAAAHVRIVKDSGGQAASTPSLAQLPPLDIGLVADGPNIIPALRGPIRGPHPDWEWIVEPGQAWTDPDDEAGWSRASLPVALRERNANCTHNGVLTWRYRDTEMSPVLYQFSSETCAYLQLDLWGQLQASLTPAAAQGRGPLIAAWRAEVAARMPARPITELASRYPGINPASFGAVAEVDPDAMTTWGFVADGLHWTGACHTRNGDYPYCDVLDLPSYSLAKSLLSGMALMRLEKLYPGSRSRPISDGVADCRSARWSGVSLENALDMTTGNYDSLVSEADEDSPKMLRFFLTQTHAEKTDMACGLFAHKSPPGEKFVYHTLDTYLLGSAIQTIVQARLGAGADIYRDLVARPLWEKLGLSPVTGHVMRTYDAAAQPLTGWGLTFHRDDLARIANFLQSGAMIDSEPAVDPAMLAAAMQRNPADRGLSPGPGLRYNNGFWAWNAGPAVGCKADVWVPFLSGYGGIIVALFPNGLSYYFVSDGRDFMWARAARAAHTIRSVCPA
jgi:hypothetical protein